MKDREGGKVHQTDGGTSKTYPRIEEVFELMGLEGMLSYGVQRLILVIWVLR